MFLGGKRACAWELLPCLAVAPGACFGGFVLRTPFPEIEHILLPKNRVQFEPIISCRRTCNGNDEDFTQALGEHFYVRDGTRFGSGQAHLLRSEDFMRFCCY